MCHRRKAGRKRCRVGMMSLATSCDITRHHAIGSGSRSGAGGVRRHSSEGVAEEGRGGGSRKRKRKTSGRRKRKGFPLQLPWSISVPSSSTIPSASRLYCNISLSHFDRTNCYIQVSIVRHKSHARSMTSITRHDPAPDTVNQ